MAAPHKRLIEEVHGDVVEWAVYYRGCHGDLRPRYWVSWLKEKSSNGSPDFSASSASTASKTTVQAIISSMVGIADHHYHGDFISKKTAINAIESSSFLAEAKEAQLLECSPGWRTLASNGNLFSASPRLALPVFGL